MGDFETFSNFYKRSQALIWTTLYEKANVIPFHGGVVSYIQVLCVPSG